MGESSKSVGLMPGGMVRRGDRAAREGEGFVVEVAVRNSAVLILAALELKPLLSAMLLFVSLESHTKVSSSQLLELAKWIVMMMFLRWGSVQLQDSGAGTNESEDLKLFSAMKSFASPHTNTHKRKMRPHHFPRTLYYIYSIHSVLCPLCLKGKY